MEQQQIEPCLYTNFGREGINKAFAHSAGFIRSTLAVRVSKIYVSSADGIAAYLPCLCSVCVCERGQIKQGFLKDINGEWNVPFSPSLCLRLNAADWDVYTPSLLRSSSSCKRLRGPCAVRVESEVKASNRALSTSSFPQQTATYGEMQQCRVDSPSAVLGRRCGSYILANTTTSTAGRVRCCWIEQYKMNNASLPKSLNSVDMDINQSNWKRRMVRVKEGNGGGSSVFSEHQLNRAIMASPVFYDFSNCRLRFVENTKLLQRQSYALELCAVLRTFKQINSCKRKITSRWIERSYNFGCLRKEPEISGAESAGKNFFLTVLFTCTNVM
ncbi:hypothetical protein CBL_03505 [Carabus blaptoides fortunei]